MNRSRTFLAALLATPLVFWWSRAEDPIARVSLPDPAWEFQLRVLVDRPALPEFVVEGKPVPEKGRIALIVLLEAGKDPAGALDPAAEWMKGREGVDVFWAAPDEATAGQVKAGWFKGSVSKTVDALVTPPIRPALLVVSQDARVAFAHFPGLPGGTSPLPDEIAFLRHAADPGVAAPSAPAPGHDYRGALGCAACHRAQVVDWLLTPHSDALDGLARIHRDRDETCLACHVAGFKTGGFAARDTDRRFGDVQCEACHVPDRLHAGNRKMDSADYAARCTACHEGAFALMPDVVKAVPVISHPNAGSADKIDWGMRQSGIAAVRERMYFEFCSRADFVGSAACKECHAKSHLDWKNSPHASAFKTLEDAGKGGEARCIACHATGVGHRGGFVDKEKTPDLAGVGCESCHGPGRQHLDAKTREDRMASIFRFDDKCPTCVVQRICRACHDTSNDPGFDLGRSLDHVRHRDK